MTTKTFRPAFIPQDRADAIILASPHWDDLDDFSWDPAYGHVYHLADGSYVLIAEGGRPVRFAAHEQPGSV